MAGTSAQPRHDAGGGEGHGSAAAGRRFWTLLVLGVVALAAAAYRAQPGGWFVRDDFMWLYDARRQVADPQLFLTWRPNDYFRPLSNLVFGLEYLLFGLEPRGYLLAHLGLHVWNAVWVAVLAHRLFGSRPAAAAAGLTFAVLQRPAAAVLWISSLVTLLAAAAILPTVACHLAFLRRGGRARYALTLLGVVACLGAKESGAIVLPLLVLVELRERGWRGFLARATWLRYAPLLALGAAYLLVQSELADGAVAARMNVGFLEGSANVLRAVVANWFLSFNPWQGATPALRGVGYGLAAIAAVLALAAWLGGRRGLLDALVAHGVTLLGFLPFSVFLVTDDILTGRYAYLSCAGAVLGLALVFGLAWQRAAERLGRFAPALPAVLLGIYLAVQVAGTDDYARTNIRYRVHGHASRLLASSLVRELDRAGESRRLILVGAPVENLRHLQCLVAVFTPLPFEAVDERRFDLSDPELEQGLASGGVGYLLRQLEADRALVWTDGGGLRAFLPERDPPPAWLLAALARNWRDLTQASRAARVQILAR